MQPLDDLIARARAGDLDACGLIVRATQAMAVGAAAGVLRDPALAEDAAQEAYLRAFRRLGDLHDPGAFRSWLRRIVITVAINMRRARRRTFVALDDAPDVPVLDEDESAWTDGQRQRLAAALLTLTPEDRRLCDRRYHGGWSTARLAREAGVDEAAMRKRLQRVRDRLRKEIEVTEQQNVAGRIQPELPGKIVELLARPRLTDLPENPVGRVLDQLRACYPEFDDLALPEIVDFAAARQTVGDQALYLDPAELHRVSETSILRYDLTLPMLLTLRYAGQPLRAFASGKTYRVCQADATHLEAFHQAEVFWMDEHSRLDPWLLTARVLRSVDALFPSRQMKIVPTEYPMCSQAWELEIESDGRWVEALAWGVFAPAIVAHLGGDPERHVAAGVGHGLERLAMLRYGIDDARKMESVRVA